MLGNGQVHVFDVYAATVLWDGQPRTVEADETDTIPLIVMGLLYRHEIRIQAIDGGLVTIVALSQEDVL